MPKHLKCKLCKKSLPLISKNEKYIYCESCGTFSVNSTKSAEDDNNSYFNQEYKKNYETDYTKNLIFRIFAAFDHFIHLKRDVLFKIKRNQVMKNIFNLSADQALLEIGFGNGDLLLQCLNNGINAIGVDSSLTAINNFKQKNPQYKKNVFAKLQSLQNKFDIIYCAALLEHLDNPKAFIKTLAKYLKPQGKIIVDALPLITHNQSTPALFSDISFWYPCHRIICSVASIKRLLDNNLHLEKPLCLDPFNNRLLSEHKKAGINIIESVRNATVINGQFPALTRYIMLCGKALFSNSLVQISCITLTRKNNK